MQYIVFVARRVVPLLLQSFLLHLVSHHYATFSENVVHIIFGQLVITYSADIDGFSIFITDGFKDSQRNFPYNCDEDFHLT